MKKNFFVLGVFCLSLFAACDSDRRTAQGDGYQDTTATGTDTRAGMLEDDTREFMTDAASGGMMEVELGRIVQQKATNQDVKDFAAMMVKDHSAANERLMALAQSKNIQLPQQMKEDHQEEVNRFRDMKAGQDFDKEYVKLMVEDHEEDIKEFEEAQEDVQDAEIRQWVDNTLQSLRQHKQRIDQIKEAMDKRS
ncbi:DUF4142 domain-containing protein [Cesiribacter andamanensis]|uniref:Putative outer membrane protein n=1 Tax=Cesiribacter andamanensis AMV16 TaxID=1279009 RepID=M7N158_9BACT|nr:DUF4142 domain-containing protein [Cesiribacter andamanensis]EMR02408.1 putative outer membrane protein [Cesiribacter andamanensis AMV16]